MADNKDQGTVFTRNKSLILLISLTLLIILYPYFEATTVGSILVALLLTAVLLSGIYAVSYDFRYVAAGILLAIPTFVLSWSDFFSPSGVTTIAEQLFITVFLGYTIIVLLKHIFLSKNISFDEIFGGVGVYIMIGLAFTQCFSILNELSPGAFYSPTKEITNSTLLYMSFVTLSTVGFGDVTPNSPMAQSLVIIETIIGVIYVAVLIGTLVNSGGLWKSLKKNNNKERDRSLISKHASIFSERPWILIIAAVMLNYATSILMFRLGVPFFLDTWATSFSVMIGGFYVGALAGILYNLLMALTYWGTSSWVWMFSSILVAASTYYFWKRGWVNLQYPGKLVSAGIITGILNAALATVIIYAFNISPYQGTLPVYYFFYSIIGDNFTASVMEEVVVEMLDKTISLTIAAAALLLIQDILGKAEKSEEVEEE